ncbi:MAG: SdpI family protein [Methanoregula sp.]|nr:SdpI family protein [Methanoregula sp.]
MSPNLTMPVMIGGLFVYIGFLMEHAEPNWFVGIRTPWTMSSEMVWKKTHQKGATLFKLAGALSFIGILAGIYAWLFILIPAIAVATYTVVYSYVEFERERKTGAGK